MQHYPAVSSASAAVNASVRNGQVAVDPMYKYHVFRFKEGHTILRTIFCTMIMAAAAGGFRCTPNQRNEQAAPPDRFVVTTNAGMRLTGAAARIEIKHPAAAKAPEVEVVLSASDSSGRIWAVQSTPPPGFLETLTLSAQVVDRPLKLGNASVQVSLPGAAASFGPSGLLKLRVQAGRLMGEASGMNDEFSAKFEGPFVVTCSVPAASMVVGAPSPTSGDAPPALVVDEKFESMLCKRYAALAGRSH